VKISADPTVCVIGAGRWGKNLVRNFHELGALRGVYDSDPHVRDECVNRYPTVKPFRTLSAALEDEQIDAVVIATPAATHGSIALQCLQAGKHVFVEKPLCLDLEEATELCLLAENNGLCLMVGHLLLYHPAYIALKNAVGEGLLGELRYLYSNRLNLGQIRREENSLWSFAPHDVSMICDLLGRMPQSVMTNGGSYLHPPIADTTISYLEFSLGVQAHIFVSWLHPYKDQRLIVIGSKAMAVFNDLLPVEEKLLIYEHTAEWHGTVPVVNKAAGIPLAYENIEPLNVECRHFLDSIKNKTQPISDGAEGRRVLTVLRACDYAMRTGQAVPIDDSRTYGPSDDGETRRG